MLKNKITVSSKSKVLTRNNLKNYYIKVKLKYSVMSWNPFSV